MIIAATCATIAAMLSYASGGDTIELTGQCGLIEISKAYDKVVTIQAAKATVKGLRISGTNIFWRGGQISAPDGLDGSGPNGYAVKINGTNIKLQAAVITRAKKGVVVDQADAVVLDHNKFWRLREDGIIASRTARLTVTYNTFSETKPLPTTCTLPSGQVFYGMASRDCDGTWVDGNHADAMQMRNGVTDVTIANNTVTGETQGLTQMDTTGDAPLQRVVLRDNNVITDGYHRITLGNCINCSIKNNVVRKADGSTKKAIIIPGAASRCGNFAEDEKTTDGPCPA